MLVAIAAKEIKTNVNPEEINSGRNILRPKKAKSKKKKKKRKKS